MADDEDIIALKKRRAIIQGLCTRIRTYVDSIGTITPIVTAQLKERKDKLDRLGIDYENIQEKIELIDEGESTQRIAFEEAFFNLSATLRLLLESAPLPQAPVTPPPVNADAPDAQGFFSHVRLPKLDLPSFSGEYQEWFPFHDTFRSIIHNNASLGNIQKFQYLKGCLTGDANKIIASLEISEANYAVAWGLLKERYDNKRMIVENHIQAIIDLPSMVKENATELRQIADGASRHVHALRALKCPTEHWDSLLVHILSAKIDTRSKREWRSTLTADELPTFKQFVDFIVHRCQVIDSPSDHTNASFKVPISRTQGHNKRQTAFSATVKAKCNICRGDHLIYRCPNFLKLAARDRVATIRKHKLCTNCLRSTEHNASKCASGNCRICNLKHNTLLHISTNTAEASAINEKNTNNMNQASSSAVVSTVGTNFHGSGEVILSTAVVHAYDSKGQHRPCRVLLDCGSQANFVSKSFLTSLGIEPRSFNVSITGINKTVANASQVAKIKLVSRINTFSVDLDCIVSDQVTDRLPMFTMKQGAFEFPRNIRLADPNFNVSADIDVLIGAELFWQLLCIGQIKSSARHPLLQKTRFGWVLAGRLNKSVQLTKNVSALHATVSNSELNDQLTRFWRLEDVQMPSDLTREEAFCENHFLNNLSRDSSGRYTVKLPFKEHMIGKLGESRDIALKRLYSIERRFERDPTLKSQYSHFITEYLALGHMKEIDETHDVHKESFYFPHHSVFKGSSDPPKIRVVFDASSKSSTGLSLNDVLFAGPVIQQDLISILVRFRIFLYVLVADIIKMYRQVLIDSSQTCYQRILWRQNPTSVPRAYELTTLAYGTSPASFLATRCLHHLADSHQNEYPTGSICVRRDFYVDDLLTGADTVDSAGIARDEIIALLGKGAFELAKWASNRPELLQGLSDRANDTVSINQQQESCILGMRWNQTRDTFHFSYQSDMNSRIVSKRVILSEVSKLFDPLGLLGPIIVIAKLILQDLWQANLHWDEAVPPDLNYRWTKLKVQIHSIDQLSIPRCVKPSTDLDTVEVHGFCDASQQAYGACVYVRTRLLDGTYQCELLCAKSRVAPLKAMTLPRLELSAAFLLALLIKKLNASFDFGCVKTFLWSDSTIVLNWIMSPSRKWAVFVANRVGEIQRVTDPTSWRHIDSSNNPADILSRGLEPQELIRSSLWWHGPAFLTLDREHWPNSDIVSLGDEIPERKKQAMTVRAVEDSVVDELIGRYSSLHKACRIGAYCLRFFKSHRPDPPTVFVSHSEINVALNAICRAVQQQVFSREYKALKNKESIGSTSNLLFLAPFLDENGLIRVGGRLKNSDLSFDAAHQILLPRDHVLTKRIIEYEHQRMAHSGAQATMASVRQRFWPLSLRSITRRVISKCVTCFKAKPILSEAVMGDLPAGRVTVSRPFHHCGVDYAGPLIIRESKRRNARNNKAYVALFVCFATKAIHVKLVGDMTSDAFIAALKRFISRRGKPACIYSDNGTTFVGTQKRLKEFRDSLDNKQGRDAIIRFLRDQETTWQYIPPNAPHFGGLWEAAVKSVKKHLNRIVGQAHLTFEELQTVLCEIEAILNSRPLTPLSTDPNDLSYISPGHFLVGTPLNSFPYPDICDVKEQRLIRWQRVEQLRQHFWRRWSTEYIHSYKNDLSGGRTRANS